MKLKIIKWVHDIILSLLLQSINKMENVLQMIVNHNY